MVNVRDLFSPAIGALGEPVRVLMSARDAATALYVSQLAGLLGESSSVSTQIVASNPVLSMLEGEGLSLEPWDDPSRPLPPDSLGCPDELSARARELLDGFRPHAVVVGQSGLTGGPDNTLIALARTPHTYMIQDFPGSIPRNSDFHPRTCFVRNRHATDLLADRFAGRTVEIGSMLSWKYARMDVQQARAEARRSHLGTTPLIGFYGQPLWSLAGYEKTLRAFAEDLAARAERDTCPVSLFYRPHLEETAEQTSRALEILSRAASGVTRDPVPEFAASAAAVDLMVTCFSTSADERTALQANASSSLGGTLMLLFEPDLREFLLRDTGAEIPWADAGEQTGCVLDRISLPEALRQSLRDDVAQAQWSAAKELVNPADNPFSAILSTIAADLARQDDKVRGGAPIQGVRQRY